MFSCNLSLQSKAMIEVRVHSTEMSLLRTLFLSCRTPLKKPTNTYLSVKQFHCPFRVFFFYLKLAILLYQFNTSIPTALDKNPGNEIFMIFEEQQEFSLVTVVLSSVGQWQLFTYQSEFRDKNPTTPPSIAALTRNKDTEITGGEKRGNWPDLSQQWQNDVRRE